MVVKCKWCCGNGYIDEATGIEYNGIKEIVRYRCEVCFGNGEENSEGNWFTYKGSGEDEINRDIRNISGDNRVNWFIFAGD